MMVITYFRKVQKRMLGDKQYKFQLKSIIGEIIMVVVGILIALQINGWNEKRKLNKVKKDYYKQLILDIKADINYAKSMIEVESATLEKYKQYNAIFTESNLKIDTILRRISYNDFSDKKVIFKTNTITSLINTGDIKLLKNNIRSTLTNYESLKHRIVHESVNNYNHAFSILQHAAMEGATALAIGRFINQAEYKKATQIEKRYGDILLKTEAYLHWKISGNYYILETLKELIKKAEETIKTIQKELDKEKVF